MQQAIKTVALVGAGNVASHLGEHLRNAGIEIRSCWSRDVENARLLAKQLGSDVLDDLHQLPPVDLVLLCVSDDAIASVLQNIPCEFNVAYTSGSVELSSLPSREKLGVFYPLQTFTKGKRMDLSMVPILIESTNETWGNELHALARKVSSQVHFTSSDQRKLIHVGAVMVNNFTNHLAFLAQQFFESKQLDFDLLKPLLTETIQKLHTMSPFDAQTGPARRGDFSILDQHKKMLGDKTSVIYEVMSNSILETYKK